ncbi:galectin-4 [Biomphalaria glabrata]|uniref:Galectin n=1 Tax=Biomphalaria glabrata TaxID=6526 RepID=A0A9W2ZZC5_BIOGL|nr:galectin-4-like [Biomphalaria glabrata]XP_055880288.1 galectin-4-like [Biomphalaria glabrata]KAI8744573.1 galectin-4 [Biomphalaria glabrata]KAI8747503.1 galectin-4-like [Biomphalaria glabrata]
MGNNIFLPYSGHISGGVHIGTDVVISGRTLPSFNRFSINLCSGPNIDSGDVAFHFNPRFNDGKVVRNHKQGGQWGAEETHGGMPFRRGHNFELHMKVTHHGFKVTVNHHHFCDFNYRLPKETINYIYIEGDATITFIQFRGGSSFPTPSFNPVPSYQPPPPAYPTGQVFPPVPSFPSAPAFPGPVGPIYNPPVPFTTPIPGGLYPGKIIYITGVPYPNPSRFTVNLACGPFDSSDFALHFDVRFNFGSDRNQVVRTHKQGGSYGSEDRFQNYFPFFPSSNFEIMILTEPNSFKIAVNNQHFTEFFHRIQPVQRVDHLMVLGDVSLTQVRFQ